MTRAQNTTPRLTVDAGRPEDRRQGRNNPQISQIAQMRCDDAAFICEICG